MSIKGGIAAIRGHLSGESGEAEAQEAEAGIRGQETQKRRESPGEKP